MEQSGMRERWHCGVSPVFHCIPYGLLAVYRNVNGVCCSLIGIHVDGGIPADSIPPYTGLNAAIRINKAVFNQLNKWKEAVYP